MNQTGIFHLAIPISNVAKAKQFYAIDLGCTVGRENSSAVIFNFFGSQLVGHVTYQALKPQQGIYPRHLGLILPSHQDWSAIYERGKSKELNFYQDSKLRFAQQALEHYSFFLEDPFCNLIEFKYYSNSQMIFGGRESNLIGETKASSSSK